VTAEKQLTARPGVAIAAGTMKTSYCLVTAAGVAAAALAVYTAQYPGWSGAQELPPLPKRSANADDPPGQLGIADGGLPPIVTPPDAPLVIPIAGKSPQLPIPPMTAEPGLASPIAPPAAPALPKPPTVPTAPVAPPTVPAIPPVAPAVPPVPTVEPPLTPPNAIVPLPLIEPVKPTPPATPALPVPPVSPVEPVKPATPTTPPVAVPTINPTPPPVKPEVPVAPPPSAVLPQPAPLPQPTTPPTLPLLPPPSSENPAAGPASGKFLVLKGNKLVEAGVSVAGEKAIIRQGSLERVVPKADVLYVAETPDEVYRFMLAKVSATDVAARLGVARWCMFAGLREQALTEAREILKLDARNISAADMARSLEESLKAFPADGSVPVVAAKTPGGALVAEIEPDVTPEGAAAFVSRAQPVLANQCMECHARPDYPGTFKLIRITGFEAGPQSTKANLRVTAAQLKKDDPLNSPLLTKALTAHGDMKQPAFVSRQAVAFRVLEAWVLLASGPIVQPMNPPTPTAPTPPATVTPAGTAPVLPPVEPPVIPPAVDITPVKPPVDASITPVKPPVVAVPLPIPSVEPQPPVVTVPPVAPPVIPLPPVDPVPVARPPVAEPRVPPVLPTPPSLPSAEVSPKSPAPLPPIPPVAPLPKPPTGGGQFGTQPPPKPPAPTGPAGGDEFDPDGFNKPK
jgi:hypothetical protein